MTNLNAQANIINVLTMLNKNGLAIDSVCLKTGKIVLVVGDGLPEEEWKVHARNKRKIDAIKAYRTANGGQACGLAVAKQAVEEWMAREGIVITYP